MQNRTAIILDTISEAHSKGFPAGNDNYNRPVIETLDRAKQYLAGDPKPVAPSALAENITEMLALFRKAHTRGFGFEEEAWWDVNSADAAEYNWD